MAFRLKPGYLVSLGTDAPLLATVLATSSSEQALPRGRLRVRTVRGSDVRVVYTGDVTRAWRPVPPS